MKNNGSKINEKWIPVIIRGLKVLDTRSFPK